MRSLHARIAKNGALNTFTVGRYLDQIATALEYAHEHAVIHGGLSVNSTFIRLDGQMAVADVGVRSLLELSRQDLSRNQLLEWSEGYVPEQLLGKPASPATDVYALGTVVYHLLTGPPAFEASTLDELVQLHMYASIPPLTGGPSDLPPGLFSVLARALAKDPAQRYQQPGAFANAYHNATDPTNRTRLPFVVASETPRMQAHQSHGTGLPLADIPFTEHAWSNNGSTLNGQTSTSMGSTIPSSIPHSQHGFSDAPPAELLGPRPR